MKVVGIGAGGHAKVVVEILRLAGDHEIVGLVDIREDLWGRDVLGVPVLGDDRLLAGLHQQGVAGAFLGVGMVADPAPRRRLALRLQELGFRGVTGLHPGAHVSPSARLGEGVTVMAGAVVNAEARLGDFSIVNSGAVVEHDCRVGAHAHIATGARLASTVRVGPGAHVGAGATVRECVSIGSEAVVGAGAVVLEEVADGTTVVGVPARPLQNR